MTASMDGGGCSNLDCQCTKTVDKLLSHALCSTPASRTDVSWLPSSSFDFFCGSFPYFLEFFQGSLLARLGANPKEPQLAVKLVRISLRVGRRSQLYHSSCTSIRSHGYITGWSDRSSGQKVMYRGWPMKGLASCLTTGTPTCELDTRPVQTIYYCLELVRGTILGTRN
jgi:hypothetical protein